MSSNYDFDLAPFHRHREHSAQGQKKGKLSERRFFLRVQCKLPGVSRTPKFFTVCNKGW